MTAALVVSRFFPYNAERVYGIYQRLGAQIQALSRVVDRVDCLFLVPVDQNCEPEFVRRHEERLRELWTPTLSIKLAPTVSEKMPQSLWQRVGRGVFDFHAQFIARQTSTAAAVSAVGAALDARPELVLAHRLVSMSPLMRVARQTPERTRGIPIFLDMDDIEHVALARGLVRDPGWPAQRLLLLQLPTLMLGEMQAMRLATTTFVCSETDRRCLQRYASRGSVRLVPNSVSFPTLGDRDTTEPLVLFVGALGYRPNAQAADSLVQRIWPLIRAQVPGARLAIIGPGREQTASYPGADPTVSFTGFVDDLQSWYSRARVVCCPIYHGGGTRVKIIEAAAYAKAIVSTHLGAEGLEFIDGSEILLRDEPAEIAAACVQLLRDPAAAARLGRTALLKARATYERSAILTQLEAIFRAGYADSVRSSVPA